MVVAIVVATLIQQLVPATGLAAGSGSDPASARESALAPHVPETLLVGFRRGVAGPERARVRKLIRASFEPLSPLAPDAERWRLPAGASLVRAIETLRADRAVRYVEPDYLVTRADGSDDPIYLDGRLWGMHGDGIASGGNPFGTGADEAWAAGRTGSRQIYVGVIDEGIQITHPDLSTNIWVNDAEATGDPGVDDDGNGYIDDLNGWDFHSEDASVYDPGSDDHGTHVAGTIGGLGGNGIGVAGVDWQVTLVPAKFLGPDGGRTSDAIRAIDYLTRLKQQGFDVVATSNSWGGGGYSQALVDAIDRGGDEGILFVAAAGNDLGSNNDALPVYPASHTCTTKADGTARGWDCIVTVASIDRSGGISSFSNYGPGSVDLAAPGEEVWSTVPPDAYAAYDGTSMATPHVAGALALCASIDPDLDGAQLRAAILATAVPTPALVGAVATGGRLDVGSLTEVCSASAAPPSGTPTSLAASAPTRDRVELTWSDGVTGEVYFEIQAAPGTIATCEAFRTVAYAASDGTTATVVGLDPGTDHCFRVRAVNWAGATGWAGPVERRTGAGAPDYVCSAIPLDWVEPVAGTDLALGDDDFRLLRLPFPHQYFGLPYEWVAVSSNGFIEFGASTGAYNQIAPLPSTGAPRPIAAPAWADLDPSKGGAVTVTTSGEAPARRFTVTWGDVPHYGRGADGVSFQLVLDEATPGVRFQYLDMLADDVEVDFGARSSAGVQDSTGTVGTQVSYRNPGLASGSALRCAESGATVAEPEVPPVDLGRFAVNGPIRSIVNDPVTGITYLGGRFTKAGLRSGPVALVAPPDAPGGDAGLIAGSPEVVGVVDRVIADDRPGDPGLFVVGQITAVDGVPLPGEQRIVRVHRVDGAWEWDPTWELRTGGCGYPFPSIIVGSSGPLIGVGQAGSSSTTGVWLIDRTTGVLSGLGAGCGSDPIAVDPLPALAACSGSPCYGSVGPDSVAWDETTRRLLVGYTLYADGMLSFALASHVLDASPRREWVRALGPTVPIGTDVNHAPFGFGFMGDRLLLRGHGFAFDDADATHPSHTALLEATTGIVLQRWNGAGRQAVSGGGLIQGGRVACLTDTPLVGGRPLPAPRRTPGRVFGWVAQDASTTLLCAYERSAGTAVGASVLDRMGLDLVARAQVPSVLYETAEADYLIGERLAVRLPSTGAGPAEAIDWRPDPALAAEAALNGASIAVVAGGIAFGGRFAFVGGVTAPGVIALDAANRLVPGFDAPFDPDPLLLDIKALALTDGWLVAGGSFRYPGDDATPGVAALDPATGRRAVGTGGEPWSPGPLAPNGEVLAIAADPGGGFWVGSKSFTSTEGLLARFASPSAAGVRLPAPEVLCLSAVAPETMSPTCGTSGGGAVSALEFDDLGRLHLAGSFGGISDGTTTVAARGLARLTSAGLPDPSWSADLLGALDIPDGSSLSVLRPMALQLHRGLLLVGGEFGFFTPAEGGGGAGAIVKVSPLLAFSLSDGSFARPSPPLPMDRWVPAANAWTVVRDIEETEAGIAVALGDAGVALLDPDTLDYDEVASAPLVNLGWFARDAESGVFALTRTGAARFRRLDTAVAASAMPVRPAAGEAVDERLVIGGAIPQWGSRPAGNMVRVDPGAELPAAPAGVSAVPGNAAADVTWEPVDGAAYYEVRDGLNAPTCTSRDRRCRVTGLGNGAHYEFQVRAIGEGGVGIGPWSEPSNQVQPLGTLPGPPRDVRVALRDRSAGISWSTPVNEGGSAIVAYTVTAATDGTDPAAQCTWTSGPLACDLTGLTKSVRYTVTVTATSELGAGLPSVPAVMVAPVEPGSPRSVVALAADRSAGVSWLPPSADGGAPVTAYRVTATPGGRTCSTVGTSCSVPDLTNGIAYTFTVRATNVAGTGLPSEPSGSVVPAGFPTISAFSPTGGNVGTSITATGTNLRNVVSVGLGPARIAARFVETTNGTVHFSVPSGSPTGTAVTVTLVTRSGTTSRALKVTTGALAPQVTAFSPSGGVAGTLVTITGMNLVGARAVKVGSVTVTSGWTVVSPTQIRMRVDATASTGTVAVTTEGGTGTNATPFVVYGAPSIAAFTPASGPAGTAMTITGSRLLGVSAVAVGAVETSSFTSATDGAITFIVPAGATSGKVQVRNPARSSTSPSSFAVVPLPAPVAVAAGGSHSCASSVDGSLRCWGLGSSGQLGTGGTQSRTVPTVVGLPGAATSLAAGSAFTCAALTDGTARCWGANVSGQLGDGSTSPRLTPVQVRTSLTDGTPLANVVQVAAGTSHACAVLADRTLRCWGLNASGQLGRGNTTLSSSPVTVLTAASTPLTGVTAVAAGGNTTCALLTSGAVRCWGANSNGQLGNGLAGSSKNLTFATAIPIASGATEVVVGGTHTCAEMSNGTWMRCWGANGSGQLGDGTTTQRTLPVEVLASGTAASVGRVSLTGIAAIAAGTSHTCAVTAAGPRCWGLASTGQLGNGQTTPNRLNPVSVSDGTTAGGVSASGATAIACGGSHTLALLPTRIAAWGANASGQLGDATTVQRALPRGAIGY